MDLKPYAGKHVVVQLKPNHGWYVHAAPYKDSGKNYPDIVMGKDQDGKPKIPLVVPFLQGMVDNQGSIAVATGDGGKVLVELDADSIFCIDTVLSPAEKPLVQPATSPLIMP